jgi:glycopeptide antibiotics resistance protein
MQLAIGAVIGFTVTCIFGPGLLGWWYEPPVKEVFSCASSVRGAIGQFVIMQLISAAIGAVFVFVIVTLVRRRFGKRVPPAPVAGA